VALSELPAGAGRHLQDVAARTVTRVLPGGVPAPPIPVSPSRRVSFIRFYDALLQLLALGRPRAGANYCRVTTRRRAGVPARTFLLLPRIIMSLSSPTG